MIQNASDGCVYNLPFTFKILNSSFSAYHNLIQSGVCIKELNFRKENVHIYVHSILLLPDFMIHCNMQKTNIDVFYLNIFFQFVQQ